MESDLGWWMFVTLFVKPHVESWWMKTAGLPSVTRAGTPVPHNLLPDGVTGASLQTTSPLHPPKEITKDLQSTGVAQEM